MAIMMYNILNGLEIGIT